MVALLPKRYRSCLVNNLTNVVLPRILQTPHVSHISDSDSHVQVVLPGILRLWVVLPGILQGPRAPPELPELPQRSPRATQGLPEPAGTPRAPPELPEPARALRKKSIINEFHLRMFVSPESL